MENLSITSIADLQKYSGGSIVELPPFALDQPFVARLRRPSMLMLVKSGKIPNQLLSKAQRLFAEGGASLIDNENGMSDMIEILEVMAEATFVEPTYKEIKDAGVELTDDQLMFIFSYSQQGVEAIKPFHVIKGSD